MEWAGDDPVDHNALTAAWAAPLNPVRTGVYMRSNEPFDSLQWRLVTGLPSPATLTGPVETLGTRSMMGAKGTIATWDEDELAHLSLEEVSVQGERRWERVVCSRRPSGSSRSGQRVVELVHTWNERHHGAPVPGWTSIHWSRPRRERYANATAP